MAFSGFSTQLKTVAGGLFISIERIFSWVLFDPFNFKARFYYTSPMIMKTIPGRPACDRINIWRKFLSIDKEK